ncbi:mediator of RNA polymerase II transcription subunit 31 [Enteropsectra breve]|nr:mediator of RNA polymerase II transcription subunit 31 [Enteropsectra breve]
MAASFEQELEFVQLLCNNEYLRWLYQNNYFSNERFIKYLEYLKYFNSECYKKHLAYPQCLPLLEILTSENAATILSNDEFYVMLASNQEEMWRFRGICRNTQDDGEAL